MPLFIELSTTLGAALSGACHDSCASLNIFRRQPYTMIIFVHHFTIGAGAAAAFEALKLWEMRGKFTEAKFRRLMRSTVLWIPLIMMLAASGFFAWAYYESEPGASAWNLAIAGIAARALLRQSSASLLANQRVKLGTPSVASDEIRLRDVFL